MGDWIPIDDLGRRLSDWARRESDMRSELRYRGARHLQYAGDGLLTIVIDAREVVWQAPAPPLLDGPS